MEAKKIELEEWSYLGTGSTATSYANKYDGNLFLKLDNTGYPVESTIEEFEAQRVCLEIGLPFPKVYDFVTDGERYGYTGERIKGKMSYARILSQEPGRLEELCSKFTEMVKRFHQTPASDSRVKNLKENLLKEDLSHVPADVASKIKGYIKELGESRTCLHGDLNPGNLICYEEKDYWIGTTSLIYGDPIWDMADMYVLCHCTPGAVVAESYHLSLKVLKSFYTLFKKKYFGDTWNSPAVTERIQHAAMIKCCLKLKKDPSSASYILPLLRGRALQALIGRCLYRSPSAAK